MNITIIESYITLIFYMKNINPDANVQIGKKLINFDILS